MHGIALLNVFCCMYRLRFIYHNVKLVVIYTVRIANLLFIQATSIEDIPCKVKVRFNNMGRPYY